MLSKLLCMTEQERFFRLLRFVLIGLLGVLVLMVVWLFLQTATG
jgi:putative flippase GtrA